jgi:hypothetical protein
MSSRRQIPWARLVAEFLVIVTGVLVALGVDQWAQNQRDRTLEAEYLERLLDDVRYDLDELAFIRERSAVSAEHAQLVLDDGWVRRARPDSLVAITYSAVITRVPDLSRSTFNELVSSGRIELLRSRAVREALSDYDRLNGELAGFYSLVQPGYLWAWERLPPRDVTVYESTCRGAQEAQVRVVLGVCPFEWDLDVGAFRSDVLSGEGRRRIRLSANRNETAVRLTDRFIEAARELEVVLVAAQPSPSSN